MRVDLRFRFRSLPALLIAAAAGGLPGAGSAGGAAAPGPAVVLAEFIYEQAPFPQCHASTIVETREGLAAAWFGGTREGQPDVSIWVSRREGGKWSAPTQVADGAQDDGTRHPCWNPVLFQPRGGPLLLFYKVGPNPRSWWGMVIASTDHGKSWSKPRRLPEGIAGPIKNRPVQLPDGTVLCGSSTEDQGWRVHFERTNAAATEWERVGPINDGQEFGAIQPGLLVHRDGRVQALCRSRQGRITESWSADGGKSWSPMAATELPNPNSGIDALTLADGRHLVVYNHTPRGRSPLNVAISRDGKDWRPAVVLEEDPGEYSYPALIQAADGRVHVTYTWKRERVRHVVLDPAKLAAAGG